MGEKMRIYIGGLGSNVQEDDLRKTFTSPQLGTVESVEVIRTKDRSFGYLEFVPASDKGLAKLFSTYNGCLWKGGKLRLERAKEHYLFRLRREWTEDAELEVKFSSQDVDVDDSVPVLQKPKKDQDIDKMQLKLFFPKLRKIKLIPLKGTGKHKYSFQRIEIPPLPINFCDCEEHSGPTEPAKRNRTIAHETNSYRVNEDELNMMKSILNKFLEKENSSKTVNTVSNEAELTEEPNYDDADNEQIDDDEEDQVSDEDNLVINMVSRSSKRATLFEDWGQNTTAVNQESLVREPESFSAPVPEMHESRKGKLLPDKKRKQSIDENYSNNTVPPKRKGRKGGPHDSIDNPAFINTQPVDLESDAIQLSCNAASSHKSSWRDLVSGKGRTAFHISDVLTDLNPKMDAKPRPDCHAVITCVNKNDDQVDQSNKVKEDVQSTKPSAAEDKSGRVDQSSEVKDVQSTKPSAVEDKSARVDQSSEVKDVQSTKPSAVEDKSARGSSWLQKSSWLQLVGDANSNVFNLGQFFPGVTIQKEEIKQLEDNGFSNFRNGQRHRIACEDQNSHIEGIVKPQERAHEDVNATPANPTVDVLTKGQDRADLDGERSNDSKHAVEEKVESSVPVHFANLPPDNRAVGDIVISETCPFMRSAASLKEWVKTKAALSGSQKKKGKGKELSQD